MIRLSAIVDGKHCTMLTGESVENAARSCRDRFGARFEAFTTETKARAKWAEYRGKQISREDLEAWLVEQEDESEIRKFFNQLRG